jgi:hypothetical protein
MHGAKLIATKNQRDNNNNHKLNKQDKIEEERTQIVVYLIWSNNDIRLRERTTLRSTISMRFVTTRFQKLL